MSESLVRESRPGEWLVPQPQSYDVIVLANVEWESRQQRPQHLARAFASHGHRVFYASNNDHPHGYEQPICEGILELNLRPHTVFDRYSEIANDEVVGEWMVMINELRVRHHIDHAVLHVHLQSWTPFAWKAREAFGWPVVYDCMDEWDGFPGLGATLPAAEPDLVARADLVVTTAERLQDKWAIHNPNTVLVRNGVDASFFEAGCVPTDVLAAHAHPVIGFTGALAPWVDFAMLGEVARARPDWNFVLVGDVHDADAVRRYLQGVDNITLTGLRPYAEMPAFHFWFDVALIPFVVDHITAAVDPVKFYEYCATGKPIVCTPLPEIANHADLFEQATDAASMELAIEKALVDPERGSLDRMALARCNTWTDRYQRFHDATVPLWPVLSVVIVTYGRLDLTRICLQSVLGETNYPRLEVVVVDNGSPDGTASYLRHLARQDPRVRIVLNDENRGFAAANNQGLARSTGEVIVLLNNDTEVSRGWHVPLLRHLQDPTVGLVGPRTDNCGNRAKLDIPAEFKANLGGLTRHLQNRHTGETFEMRMLGMFCVAMRREVFEEVGLLDEGYGIGLFEDDDYAERVRIAGWRILCARDAFVHHVGQGTFRALVDTGAYDALWARNLARFESRWGRWHAQDAQDTSQPK